MNKIIGNTTATPNLISDWAQTDATKADYIKNKPVLYFDLSAYPSTPIYETDLLDGYTTAGVYYIIVNDEEFYWYGHRLYRLAIEAEDDMGSYWQYLEDCTTGILRQRQQEAGEWSEWEIVDHQFTTDDKNHLESLSNNAAIPIKYLKGTVVTGIGTDIDGNKGLFPMQTEGAGLSLIIYLTKAGGTNKWHFVVDYAGGSGLDRPIPLPYEDATVENTPFYYYQQDYYDDNLPVELDFINSSNQEIASFLYNNPHGLTYLIENFELTEEQLKDLGNPLIPTKEYIDNRYTTEEKDKLKKLPTREELDDQFKNKIGLIELFAPDDGNPEHELLLPETNLLDDFTTSGVYYINYNLNDPWEIVCYRLIVEESDLYIRQHLETIDTSFARTQDPAVGEWTDWQIVNDTYSKTEIDNKLSNLPTNETFQATEVSATLGDELVTSEGWSTSETVEGVTTEGWTGDFETGFVHIVGQTVPLVFSMPEATGTNMYQVEFDVADCSKSGSPNASTAFSVLLGNSEPFITYNGGGPRHYAFGIRSIENGDLKFILTAPADPFTTGGSFDGTIKNVSIKRIIEPYSALLETKDLDGDINMEIRANDVGKDNFYLGKSSGHYNTTGLGNVGVGNSCLENNTSGYWNSAIGYTAMQYNTVGSRNVAVGFKALQENVSGDRNYAIGTFALMRNTSGRFNVAIGADTLWCNTSGQKNIAIGSASQSGVTTSSGNISIGHNSMAGRIKGNRNIAIGTNAQYGEGRGSDCISIGDNAHYEGGGYYDNINIGKNSGSQMTCVIGDDGTVSEGAYFNVGIGSGSLQKVTTGNTNVAIGCSSGFVGDTFLGNTFVGHSTGMAAKGNNNTFIGSYAGSKVTSGSGNICIGRYSDTASPTLSNYMNIGSVIFGHLTKKQVSINKNQSSYFKAHLDIGKSDGTYPPLALNSGTLTETPVDGAIEYDGDALYFTDKNLSRSKLATAEDCVDEVIQALIDRSEVVEFEKTAEGSTININNISDTEHNIKCSISGVENLEGTNVVKVGKNLCPNNWEMGHITATGVESDSTTSIRTSDYFMLDKSKKYYTSVVDVDTNPTVTWFFYDKDKNFLSRTVSYFNRTIGASGSGAAVGIPNSAVYCKLLINLADTNLKAQIEIGTSATEYEDYKGQVCTSNQEGVVEGMTSISPYMHVFSSNSDANIELVYKAKGRILPF